MGQGTRAHKTAGNRAYSPPGLTAQLNFNTRFVNELESVPMIVLGFVVSFSRRFYGASVRGSREGSAFLTGGH